MRLFYRWVEKETVFLFTCLVSFYKRNGFHLAAGSTYYLLLGGAPFVITLFIVLSYFVDESHVAQFFLPHLQSYIAVEESTAIVGWLQDLLDNNAKHFTYTAPLNLLLLFWAATGFFSSLMHGLNDLTSAEIDLSKRKRVKSLALLFLTFISLIITFVLAYIGTGIGSFLKNPQFLLEGLKIEQTLIIDVSRHSGMLIATLMDSFIVHLFLEVVYFLFFFRILFDFRLNWSEGLLAAVIFSLVMNIGKVFFNLYVLFMKARAVRYFGGAYILMLPILWLHVLMVGFYFASHYISSRFQKRVSLGS